MFFKLPSGGIKTGRGFTSRDECESYIGAFKTDIPAICRPLAFPATCTLACVKPIEPPPPPPPAAKPEPNNNVAPKPDPASAKPDPSSDLDIRLTYRLGQECEMGWSQ